MIKASSLSLFFNAVLFGHIVHIAGVIDQSRATGYAVMETSLAQASAFPKNARCLLQR
jgi:hypothetical protein